MPRYIQRSELISGAPGTLFERASLEKRASEARIESSVFLSHSSKDADLLPGAIALLKRHGASVYIDKKDESLPPFTNTETATALKGRIRVCQKFVLLASANSKDSKWVPWELGLADGYRTSGNVAILPSVDSTDPKWPEQEYLGVYRTITFGKLQGFTGDVYMVWDHEKNRATELSAWLKS